MTDKLLNCPRCGSEELYTYHKVSDCVKCSTCGYFNTVENWNEGLDPLAWDNDWLIRMRALENMLRKLRSAYIGLNTKLEISQLNCEKLTKELEKFKKMEKNLYDNPNNM